MESLKNVNVNVPVLLPVLCAKPTCRRCICGPAASLPLLPLNHQLCPHFTGERPRVLKTQGAKETVQKAGLNTNKVSDFNAWVVRFFTSQGAPDSLLSAKLKEDTIRMSTDKLG